jgi:hypothetical protein
VYLVRDVFRCKPGKAKALVAMFKATLPSLEREDGFQNCRIMTDCVATYWTVVLQGEIESLERFEAHARTFGTRPEVRAALEGYMELVEGGHREIYRLE